MPTTVNIRYTTPKQRIKNLIPLHFKQLKSSLLQQHGAPESAKLMQHMGVTGIRFKLLTQNEASEPTIGELSRYADFFKIPVTDLYKPIPNKPTKKQA